MKKRYERKDEKEKIRKVRKKDKKRRSYVPDICNFEKGKVIETN